jgi:predicted RNase H-like nuclease (RuvC/YqgF family)
MKIILEIYSEENPTNLYFKSILTMNELHDLYSDFKTYNNINDIYEFMNNIINKGNYEIKFDGESAYLILLFNNTKINIILNKEKISFEPSDSELNEFINQFYKDFLDLKQNILNNKINDNNKEILELKKENQIFKDKIEEIQKENVILKNKINDLNKNLFKLKQSVTPKKKSKNYLKKEDIFNQANISKYNNIGYEYDNNSNTLLFYYYIKNNLMYFLK